MAPVDRRSFLAAASGAAGGLIPPWSTSPGDQTPAYGAPSRYEQGVAREGSGNVWRTPLRRLFGTITPNGLFFERHHAGVPRIDPSRHKLLVHGLVNRAVVLSVADLMRYPSITRICFIECSGNTGGEWPGAAAETVTQSHGLLSCAEWTGVKLSTVLDDVGLRSEARWMLAEGADGAAMDRSIPIEKALDDAILAYAQNGEHLRPEQGYPLRLVLPGFEGNTSVKWLRRLKFGPNPFYTREETARYTDLMPDGKARAFTFVMEAKSVIVAPSGGDSLPGAGRFAIRGLAWSGRGAIRAVDVSLDGGRTWHAAGLQAPVLSKALTAFVLDWSWDGKPATMMSRAIDETGYVQPTRSELVAARGTGSGYHYNAIHAWKISANGRVGRV